MQSGPQQINLKDHSTACPIGLYFIQDDEDIDHRKQNSITGPGEQNFCSSYGRPQIFDGQTTLYPYNTMINLIEETDCFKDVPDPKGVYNFIEKFKNFNTLRK